MKKYAILGVAALAVWAGTRHPAALAQHAAAIPTGPVTVNANEALANKMAAAYGWTGGQQRCLDELWTHENSQWDPTQPNLAGSGAYGIPQADPGSKMASAGPGWRTDPATQVRWGLAYVKGKYGNPCTAWDFEMSHDPNWY